MRKPPAPEGLDVLAAGVDFHRAGAEVAESFLGGLVAGADAAWVENTWPLMTGGWVPESWNSVGPAFTATTFWNDPPSLQAIHRFGAYLLFIITFVMVGLAMFVEDLVPAQRAATGLVGLLMLIQMEIELQIPKI